MITYEKKLLGAAMVVSKQMEQDAQVPTKKIVSDRLVGMIEIEAEKLGAGIDYDSITIERSEEFIPTSYQHILSRDEQPLWRFLLSLLPFTARPSEIRETPPLVQYRARATVMVPVEETS